MADTLSTPMQTLYAILDEYGYLGAVRPRTNFAKLLRIGAGNVAAYLADPGEDTHRIVPRVDTLQVWAWGLSNTDDIPLQLSIVLDGQDLYWYVRGQDSEGNEVPEGDKWATKHCEDFKPLRAWKS